MTKWLSYERPGWNPEALIAIAENRAAEERAWAGRLDAETRWRRGRFHDIMSGPVEQRT
jgi:hypothetical protein